MHTTWVSGADASGYGADNLPYGVFARPGAAPRVGVRVGSWVLDLAEALGDPEFAAPSLGPFMARGSTAWRATRAKVSGMLGAEKGRAAAEPCLVPLAEVELLRPFDVADYVVFQGSVEHAACEQGLVRPDSQLPERWYRQPAGRHGRAGAVEVSGTPVRRPFGQVADAGGAGGAAGERGEGSERPGLVPSAWVDAEWHMGFVVGVPTSLGRRVPIGDFAEHVFGVVLVEDWRARDLQAWESTPLGPLAGASFGTTIAPWVMPMDALGAARFSGREQSPETMPHLARAADWGLRIGLEVALNGEVVSRPPSAALYWTPDQLLAHLTGNGAALRTGDLFTSGAVSAGEPEEGGSLLELTGGGKERLHLADGSTRSVLEDGDTVEVGAYARGMGGGIIRLGEVSASLHPSCPGPADRRA